MSESINDNDFRPDTNALSKEHLVDASLDELARLGQSDDADFLKKMDGLLDQVDEESGSAENVVAMPTRKKNYTPLWLMGAAAVIFAGFFALSQFSPNEADINSEVATVQPVAPEPEPIELADVVSREKAAASKDLDVATESILLAGVESKPMGAFSDPIAPAMPSPQRGALSGKKMPAPSVRANKNSFSDGGGASLPKLAESDLREKLDSSFQGISNAPVATPVVTASPKKLATTPASAPSMFPAPAMEAPAKPLEIKRKEVGSNLAERREKSLGSDSYGDEANLYKKYQTTKDEITFGREVKKEAMDRFAPASERKKISVGYDTDYVKRTVSSAEQYGTLKDNEFESPMVAPLSTFSVDVDTASYANIRRMVRGGYNVPADAVRIEEMINYFSYDYPQPKEEHPFAFAVETANCPWKPEHQLMRVGIQGKKMLRDNRPEANLVFLLDVSGSMSSHNKLPYVKKSMELLVEELNEKDTISIVVYAGAEGLCLPPTKGDQKKKILQSLENLKAGGSTNGGAGIQLAYKVAKENFKKGGVNRVILCSDGDFNVGRTDEGGLVKMVEKKAKDGTFLSVLGFGSGNINDSMLEAITNKGNGNYFYIDSMEEGRKVLLQDLMSTLVTIAKDVKIQIEFNPKHVQHYRLIGYANRMLEAEDFVNDKIDAGEVGAGHSVTALYEIVPAGAPPIVTDVTSTLKYQKPTEPAKPKMKIVDSDELCTVKLRYKKPDSDKSIPMEQPVVYQSREWEEASDDYQFATAAALWGMQLRNSSLIGDDANPKMIISIANEGKGADPFGRREEFIGLVKQWKKTQ